MGSKIYNINSTLYDVVNKEIASNKISDIETEINLVTGNIWPRDIFLVNKELMDFLCPPELKQYYDPKRIKENIDRILKRGKDKSNNLDSRFSWEEIIGHGIEIPLEGEIPLYFQNFWGIYCNTISDADFAEIRVEVKKQLPQNWDYYAKILDNIDDLRSRKVMGPFIFICPERIKPFSERLGLSGASLLGPKRDFKLVLKYVIYKCVCYHYFHPNVNVYPFWTKLVNHSLATFFSLRSLDDQERTPATIFLNRGSLEDCTYLCWEKLAPSKITMEINIWLVKWKLGEPAISTSHDSQIFSKLHKMATKKNLQPTLNLATYSFDYFDQYNQFKSDNLRILNDGAMFWEDVAWKLLLAWKNIT